MSPCFQHLITIGNPFCRYHAVLPQLFTMCDHGLKPLHHCVMSMGECMIKCECEAILPKGLNWNHKLTVHKIMVLHCIVPNWGGSVLESWSHEGFFTFTTLLIISLKWSNFDKKIKIFTNWSCYWSCSFQRDILIYRATWTPEVKL